eukprot:6202863-Pleurochrysis_carterae.AAC.1
MQIVVVTTDAILTGTSVIYTIKYFATQKVLLVPRFTVVHWITSTTILPWKVVVSEHRQTHHEVGTVAVATKWRHMQSD